MAGAPACGNAVPSHDELKIAYHGRDAVQIRHPALFSENDRYVVYSIRTC